MTKTSNLNDTIELFQSKYHSDKVCIEILKSCEKRYQFTDEIEMFANLVNFSTAKQQPYQRWVRYREGYSTVLVKELMKRSGINPNESFVADPMMGSGSTLIAAKTEGFDSLGLDVNPYCELITEIKLSNPTEDDLIIIQGLMESKEWKNITFDSKDRPPLADYFPEENLIRLLKIREWLSTIHNEMAKKTLTAAWFFILENSSNRKKDGNGLATRPSPISDVDEYYIAVVKDIIDDFINHPIQKCNNYIRTESAFNFSGTVDEFREQIGKKLGCVIFSPPYANSFDYFESYKLELLFGGLMDQDSFNDNKKKLVRNYRICHKQDIDCDIEIAEALCREIKNEIPKKEAKTGKRDGRTRLMPNMIRGYFMDMKKVIEQIYYSLEEGGNCYIVVDQSAYVGVIVPTDVVLALIAEKIGFSIEKIAVCRRASTSGQQLSQYPYLKNTLRESIVCLRK